VRRSSSSIHTASAGSDRSWKTFDKSFNLPPPPHFAILQPEGPIPPFNPTKRPAMVGWAQETSLDVEYAHAIAPGANILLVETPVAETIGVTGFPQIVAAENYVIDHHLGDVTRRASRHLSRRSRMRPRCSTSAAPTRTRRLTASPSSRLPATRDHPAPRR